MFIKGFLSNSTGIIISRILGLIRDLLTAAILGAGIWADIFFIAFKVPNLFRRLFAEGAFSQAFLPSFANSKHKSTFAIAVFFRIASFILLLSILVFIFNVPFTRVIATGLDEEQIQNAAPLVATTFLYLFLIYCVTFLGALLQYSKHFATTAFSTSLLNISMILALILNEKNTQSQIAWALSYAVLAGGIAQVLLHILIIIKFRIGKTLFSHIKIGNKRKKEINLKGFFRQFWHGFLGSSAMQISSFLDTWLASFLASGSISYLFYSNRIFQLPLAVFAIALSQALFVHITKLLRANDKKKAIELTSHSFYLLLLLLGSAALFGSILSEHIIWLLFERGNFSHNDTISTAKILSAYMIGLVPFGLSKLFSLWIFAQSQQQKSAKIAIFSMVINFIIALVLIQYLKDATAIALASSISGFLQLCFYIGAFGKNNFFAIINLKKLTIVIAILIIQAIGLMFLKEFLDVFI